MIELSKSFKQFLYDDKIIMPVILIEIIDVKNEPFFLDGFVSGLGSISSSLSLIFSKFSPASHGFKILDTGRDGKVLFYHNKDYGLVDWVGKSYNIYFGFKKLSITLPPSTGSTLTIPTIGHGVKPADAFTTPTVIGYGSGDVSQGVGTVTAEELIPIYSGIITGKKEDRVNGSISIRSKSIDTKIKDVRICQTVDTNYVFEQNSGLPFTTDIKSINTLLQYGSHKLLSNTIENIERKKPFGLTVGFPNPANSRPWGALSGFENKNVIWGFLFRNYVYKSLNTNVNDYKIYAWDYMAGEWFWLNLHNPTWLNVSGAPLEKQAFLFLDTDNGAMASDIKYLTDGFGDYLNANGNYFNDPKKFFPLVAIETLSQTKNNPVSIIYELLSSDRFVNFDDTKDTGNIDISNVFIDGMPTFPLDLNYSFDRVYDKFDQLGTKINTNYNSEISVNNVIEDICKLCNISFYATMKTSLTIDRRLRLRAREILTESTIEPVFKFSTKENINSYSFELDNTDLKNSVAVGNTENIEDFEIVTAGSGKNRAEMFVGNNSKVYFFNSRSTAELVADVYFKQLSSSKLLFDFKTNKHGMPLELGDIIEIHDGLTDQKYNAEISKISFNLETTQTNIQATRYENLYI